MDDNPWEKFEEEMKNVSETSKVAQSLTLKEDLDRLAVMYAEAKRSQLGITMGLIDIWTEVHLAFKNRGMQTPQEVLEFFKP